MKKKSFAVMLCICLLVSAAALAACGGDPVPEPEITVTVSPASASVVVGQTVKLDAETNSGQTPQWSSDKTAVATVDQTGKVTGVADGRAIITVTVEGKSAECSVTVEAAPIEGDYSILVGSTLTLLKGDAFTLTPTLKFGSETVTGKTLGYTSADPAVASVGATGEVRGLTRGKTDITVSFTEGAYSASANVAVTVTGEMTFAINRTQAELAVTGGDPGSNSVTLSAEVFENNEKIQDAEFTWDSSDEAVATVTDGVVTAVGKGAAEISASYDGMGVTCQITVYSAYIGTAAEFEKIYKDLSGHYKLTADLTVVPPDSVHQKPYELALTGVLDGGGHTITTAGGKRLFGDVGIAGQPGAVRDLNLVSEGPADVWGGLVAFRLISGTVTNVRSDLTLKSTRMFNDSKNYFTTGSAGLFGLLMAGVIEDCTVYMIVPDTISVDNDIPVTSVAGIATVAGDSTDVQIKNCRVYSNNTTEIQFLASPELAAITGAAAVQAYKVEYKTEYYLPTDNGYALEDSETLSATVLSDVTIPERTYAGYQFDADADNVLSGKVAADGSLILKRYYKKSPTLKSDRQAYDLSLAAEQSGTATLAVKDYATDAAVDNSAVTWKSADPNVATVANGVITAVAKGTVKVSATYNGGILYFEISVWTKLIGTKEDFATIYNDLAGYYKLTADMTVESNSHAHNPPDGLSCFTGVLDGGNHSITTDGTRLFYEVGTVEAAGVIRNMTVTAPECGVWGGLLGYRMLNGTVENITAVTRFISTRMFKNQADWFAAGSGSLFQWVANGTLKNCTATVTTAGIKLPETEENNSIPFDEISGLAGIAADSGTVNIIDCKVYSDNTELNFAFHADRATITGDAAVEAIPA